MNTIGIGIETRPTELDLLRELEAACLKAKVQRDPRHRVSMLVNDWQPIEAVLIALDERRNRPVPPEEARR